MIPVLTQVSLQVRGAGLSSDCQKVFLVVVLFVILSCQWKVPISLKSGMLAFLGIQESNW